MWDKLQLDGLLTGTYEDNNFKAEFKDHSLKLYFDSIDTLRTLKDLFFDKVKKLKDDPKLKEALEKIDIEIYLEKELIVKIGKRAKTNFISGMLGIPYFEVVANSRMSDLMSLL